MFYKYKKLNYVSYCILIYLESKIVCNYSS